MYKSILFLFLIFSVDTYAREVAIRVKSIKKTSGLVYIIVDSNEKSFESPSEKDALFVGVIQAKQSEFMLKININKDVKKIAVTAFHDENMNKKLDVNIIGIPKEAFGFSMQRKKTNKYHFDDVATTQSEITVELAY